jgi:hypothetical protein
MWRWDMEERERENLVQKLCLRCIERYVRFFFFKKEMENGLKRESVIESLLIYARLPQSSPLILSGKCVERKMGSLEKMCVCAFLSRS